uniref:Zinc finger, CCHC-type n=1 Tax=Tanacetum cinerariifolium TaxID=118510 RepID=A0A6L2LC52_TANCI|nr:zinc finger, CCHC-type [Tanacetum cinerariifolium]
MATAMKHMASNFAKLKKFEGVNFRIWQKKMHFLLSSMSVVYVLTTLLPEDGGENPTVEQVRRRAKCDNKDYVCRGLILNGMSDSLFDIYQNVDTSKELWDTLEAKCMVEDASSKKFLVSNFTNYKMTDLRPVLEQYNELLGILRSHLRIEESLSAQDHDNPKSNNAAGPLVVNMVEYNNSFRANGSNTKGSEDGSSNPLKGQSMFNKSRQIYYVTYVYKAFFVQDDDVVWWVDSGETVHVCKDRSFMSTSKLNDSILWHARLGHVYFKRMQDMFKDGLIPAIDMDTKNDLCDLHATPSLGNKKYFVTFIDDASRKKHVFDFSFDYLVENAEQSEIFWADKVSKYNYKEFGDVVSFDATFKTNKYKMVFVSFTAIDNHMKCVRIAAGLLKNETTKSYIWLLKEFMKAFGKAPSIVVTDYDEAMRNAIEAKSRMIRMHYAFVHD